MTPEAIGLLGSGIAHEYNNLLVPIMANSERGMNESIDTEEQQAKFAQINQAATRIAEITDNLMAFTRSRITQLKPTQLHLALADQQHAIFALTGDDIDLAVQLEAEQDTI